MATTRPKPASGAARAGEHTPKAGVARRDRQAGADTAVDGAADVRAGVEDAAVPAMHADVDDKAQKARGARRPGRPRADSAALRERLLDAAQECFAQHGVAGATLRSIALAAGVTPALVHYYFVDKQRLFEALVGERIAPIAAGIAQVLTDTEHTAAERLARFIDAYMATMASRLWLPKLLVHEVLSHEGEFRSFARERFIGPVLGGLLALVRQAQAEGSIRADLDPTFAALSIVSLNVFPFVSAPVSWPALGLVAGPDLGRQLAAHTRSMLFHGIEDRGHATSRR